MTPEKIPYEFPESGSEGDDTSCRFCHRVLSAQDTESLNQYMTKLATFLAEYSWLYDFPLIDVLTAGALEKIPVEWVSCLSSISPEVRRNIPYGYTEQFWPESLKRFITESVKLSISHVLKEEYPNSIYPNNFMRRGMSPKKIHEVVQMTETIHRLCALTGANVIIDVGSGLGYLDQALSDIYKYQVVGIEVEESRCHGAELRLKKQNSSSDIRYVNMRLENNSTCLNDIQLLVHQQFIDSNKKRSVSSQSEQDNSLETSILNEEKDLAGLKCQQHSNSTLSSSVCIVGLHCCGDLTSSMLQISTCIEEISSLVCLPCCYHKMEWNGKEQHFKIFPSSKYGRQCLKKFHLNSEWKASTFLMRLAAQQTRSRWCSQTEEQHEFQNKNNAFRAVLQAYVNKENLCLKKKKRNISWNNAFSSFDDYLKVIIDNYEVAGNWKSKIDVLFRKLLAFLQVGVSFITV